MTDDRYDEKPGRPFGAEPSEDHPWVVMVDGVRNHLSFATAEDAQLWGLDLQSRWFGFDHFSVVHFLTGDIA